LRRKVSRQSGKGFVTKGRIGSGKGVMTKGRIGSGKWVATSIIGSGNRLARSTRRWGAANELRWIQEEAAKESQWKQ